MTHHLTSKRLKPYSHVTGLSHVTRPQSLAKAAELKKSTIQIPSTTTSSVDKHPRYRLDRAASVKMKLNISYPANGSQKIIEVDDERKLRPFMEKRMGTEVSTPHPIPRLVDQLEKGYTHTMENNRLIGIYFRIGCRRCSR
jgi:hypothetical protein